MWGVVLCHFLALIVFVASINAFFDLGISDGEHTEMWWVARVCFCLMLFVVGFICLYAASNNYLASVDLTNRRVEVCERYFGLALRRYNFSIDGIHSITVR